MKRCISTINSTGSYRKVTLPEMLTESLGQETRYDYHWSSAVKVVSRLAFGTGMVLLVLFIFLAYRAVVIPLQSPLLLVSLLLVSLGFYASEAFHDRKRKQERLITKLQNHAVAVGPALMLMHREQDFQVSSAAAEVLKAHLPKICEQDYATFSAPMRASLCNLMHNADQELAMAAIVALKYVGDERTIGPLRLVLAGRDSSDAARNAARISLQAVSIRSSANRQARTLLRAGSPAEAVPSSLLRSSAKGLESGREQLVRAVK